MNVGATAFTQKKKKKRQREKERLFQANKAKNIPKQPLQCIQNKMVIMSSTLIIQQEQKGPSQAKQKGKSITSIRLWQKGGVFCPPITSCHLT
jgi:hypothetical protein